MFFMEDAMSRKNISRRDEPLESEDLRKCHQVMDAICRELAVSPGSEEGTRVAAITIELYQQGVRQVSQLHPIVGAACGLNVIKLGTKR
jgi:hypothetical protein